MILTVGSCSWGGADEGPVNPSTKLEVVSTYPPDGGTGPFDLYTPNPDTVKPHFTVHFSKSMKLSTLDQTTVECEGFSEPAVVKVLNYVSHDGDIVGFQITSKATGSPLSYQINSSYSVTIRAGVEDDQGHQLGSDYRFTFRPEPYFRVTGFSFGDGDTIVPTAIEVLFNSRLQANIHDAIAITPSISATWSIDPTTDSSSVIFDVFAKIKPSTVYSVLVGSGATDARNNPLQQATQRSFFAPPLIISQNQFGTTGVNLAAQIVLSFNYPMSMASIAAAFSLDPSTTLVQAVEQQRLSFYAANDFIPNTDYAITLSTQLTTLSASPLPTPKTIVFHTAAFAMSHHPADQQVGVSTHNVVELDYTGAIVPSTAASAITMVPAISHHLTFTEGTPGKYITILVVPDGLLSPLTRYTVVVSNAIQSIGGYQLAQPDTFSFTTAGSI